MTTLRRSKMKKLGFTIGTIVSVASLAWSVSFSAHAAGSAKDEITAVEHKLIAATSTAQFMEHVDDKAIVLYDYVPPLQYKGASAVRNHMDTVFQEAKDLKGDFVELEVVADDKLGAARSLQHFTWKDKEGKSMEGIFRVTDVFHKVAGKWKLIHSHVSVPVDPATEKGQMNLKP
jgi:ketosteroid isomerase-like protein